MLLQRGTESTESRRGVHKRERIDEAAYGLLRGRSLSSDLLRIFELVRIFVSKIELPPVYGGSYRGKVDSTHGGKRY